jgi:ActR/RegA family two-component response regulator
MKVETVLLVDDDALTLRALARLAVLADKQVLATGDPIEARNLSRLRQPQLAVVDVLLGPDAMDGGLALIEQLRDDRNDLSIVAWSAAATAALIVYALQAGASVAVGKDMFELAELLAYVESGAPLGRRATRSFAPLARVTWEYLWHVRQTCGSVRGAAIALGLSRSWVQRALKRSPPR